MASAGTGVQTQGRRRSLDAEINLVPFIDLLSMCICFLLMTAVWMEIGAINVKQLVGTEASSSPSNSADLDVRFLGPDKVQLALKGPGVKPAKLTVTASQVGEAVKKMSVNLKLNPKEDVKAQLGRLIGSAKVTTMAGVNYGQLVSVMDALRQEGVVNLGVVPVRE